MPIGPRFTIETPPSLYRETPYGLASVAVAIPPPVSTRPESTGAQGWRNGIEWQSGTCFSQRPRLTSPVCPPGSNPAVTYQSADGAWYASDAFTLQATAQCAPAARSYQELRDQAERALVSGEAWTVERYFWQGGPSDAVHPHLSANVAVLTSAGMYQEIGHSNTAFTGTGRGVVTGLGLLEQALGDCYSGVGVIHMSPLVLSHAAGKGLVRVENGRLQTYKGTPVAVGGGYPGSGPDPADSPQTASTSWIYGTGQVFMTRGPIEFPADSMAEVINRGVNLAAPIAQRTYVLGIDCCVIPVRVDLDPTS